VETDTVLSGLGEGGMAGHELAMGGLLNHFRHKGVRWSDGQPLTARDVYYTLAILGRKGAAFDRVGLLTGAATKVTMPSATQVAITFKTVDTARIATIGSTLIVAPEHI